MTSTNSAQILNIYPKKGAILPGSDADLVVWDPKLSKTISAATQKSIIDYNVFEGFKVNGLPRYTLSRGEVVWSEGKNDQPRPGRGKLLKRKPFAAVSKALSSISEPTRGRFVRTWIGHSRGADGKTKLTLVWEPLPPTPGMRREEVTAVSVIAASTEGQVYFRGQAPAKDEAADVECKAYGAAGIMRIPWRLRISWKDDSTLQIETDAGRQTRLLHFGPVADPVESSLQGVSRAEWIPYGAGP